MKIIKMLGTLILLLTFTGCYDANEPNDYAYVVAIGVDKSESPGQYIISIQFAKPTQISGGGSEEGGKGGETLGLVTVEAPSIYSGINIANNIFSKRFQLSHTKIIVISEEIAKKGIEDIVYTVVRSIDLRPNMYMAVSSGEAREYLASVAPEIEINPVKYYQLILENTYAEFVPKNVSQDIYFYMESGEKEVILPLVSPGNKQEEQKKSQSGGQGGQKSESGGGEGDISGGGESGGEGSKAQKKETEVPKTDAKTNYEGFEYLIKEYVAGDIPANKENKSESMGMAVFSGDKMIGTMSGIESEIYNLMNKNFDYTYSTFYGEDLQVMVMLVQQYENPHILVNTDGENPEIKIKVSMEGSLIDVPNTALMENDVYNYEKKVEGYIKNAIEKFLYRTSRDFGSDIVGFGGYAKKNFSRYDDFREYNWEKKYKKAEFKVETDFKIRRTGLIIKNNEKDEGDSK